MSAAPALQPSLFDVVLEPIVRSPSGKDGRKQTIAERFAEFHDANPSVYAAIRGLALQAKRNGFRKWSTKAAFEVLRWQYAIQTKTDDYKLNNNFTAPYARLLMASEPQLAGFFETRGDHDGNED